MAITIRELLASDTISGATDKINFNFDQLLLNGGGPAGPPGIQGPPGPIGGRGIRGSIWYEGTGDPNTFPPTLTPEDEDNYLNSDDGFVWTYVEASFTWVITAVNLTGPIGPAGSGGKFAEYNSSQTPPYGTAGDTTIYPEEMAISDNPFNQSVRSTLLGGFPEQPGMLANPVPGGTSVVPQSIAESIVMPNFTLFLHQFDANGKAIVFHGGDTAQNFEQGVIGNLANIGLAEDDTLNIRVPKAPTSSSTTPDLDGLRVLTPERNQHFQAGKRIWLQAGNSNIQYGPGDLASVWIEAKRNNGAIAKPTIELRVDDIGAAYEAELRLGGYLTAPTSSNNSGDFWVEAGLIDILSNGTTTVNSGSGITMSATSNIVATSTSGDIRLNAAFGELYTTSQTVDVNSTTSIDIDAGTDINNTAGNIGNFTATNNVNIESLSADVNIDSAIDINLTANVDVNIFGSSNVNIETKTDDVHIFTGTGSGGDVLIDTNNVSSQIKLETDGATSRILLQTNTDNSPVSLSTLALSDITLNSAQDIALGAAGLVSSLSLLNTEIYSTSNILLDTATVGGGNISLSADTGSISAITQSGLIYLHSVTSPALIIGNTAGMTASGGDVNISASANVNITAETGVNASTGATFEPRLEVDASIHAVHSAQLVVALDEKIFGSGEFDEASPGNWTEIKINWTRVGNVVTGSGFAFDYVGPTGSSIFSAPIIGPNGIDRLYGTWLKNRATAVDPIHWGQLEDQGAPPVNFDVLPLELASDDGGLAVGDSIKFTFSYTII